MTSPRQEWHVVYFPLAVIAYFIATLGLGAVARVTVAGTHWSDAFRDFVDFMLTMPIGMAYLYLPFLGAEFLAVEVAYRKTPPKAAFLFCAVIAVLMWLYYEGLSSSHRALLQEQWTASSLSLGMIVVWSIPVLLGAAIAAGGLKWKF
jgi:hypothetical protein